MNKINHAVKVLKQGGIIVYPTEGVYGLGCDPFNETAVLRLLKIKRRNIKKGLLLIAANWKQVKELIKIDLEKPAAKKINKKSDSPITWVFPATKKAPRWVTGDFASIAIRVTTHPIAKKICTKFSGPLISTSANIAKKRSVRNLEQLNKDIINNIDCIVEGMVGGLGKPTKICDFNTGKVIRE